MARAKRTDRAEARRRYRQTQTSEPGPEEGSATASAPTKPAGPTPAARRGPTAAQPRLGILGAIRVAAAPADIRADLAALPNVALHSKAIWLPGLLVVATGILVLIPNMSKNVLVVLLFQAFLYPPPMAAAFLAGLLAPRASWLAGGLMGVLAAAVFTIDAVILAGPGSGAFGTGGTGALGQLLMYAWAVAPMMGIGVGAFAGFYRRFLRIAGPSSGDRSARRRPAARR